MTGVPGIIGRDDPHDQILSGPAILAGGSPAACHQAERAPAGPVEGGAGSPVPPSTVLAPATGPLGDWTDRRMAASEDWAEALRIERQAEAALATARERVVGARIHLAVLDHVMLMRAG